MQRGYRGRPKWETDVAVREVRTPEEAVERARKGRALVDAALAGQAPPEVTEKPAARVAGYEMVACCVCYTPVWGLPGSRCDTCPPDAPPDMSFAR
ncbi:hypothetical protein [Micromonospora inyonensis]|nr:hypothetical protein [Micromonospora inyonensis]SCL15091.1 hypothetical protein GA0074694_1049 [Micromonospora inyonensis]SCL33487.1 hypothetical protein GA0074694_6238 [Micromonospora inyonensis]